MASQMGLKVRIGRWSIVHLHRLCSPRLPATNRKKSVTTEIKQVKPVLKNKNRNKMKRSYFNSS